MRPSHPKRRRHRYAGARVVLVLLALTLVLALTLDGAAEAGTLTLNNQDRNGLDLCAVPGLVLGPLATGPTELSTPLRYVPTVPFLSPVVRETDHPPRPA